MFINTFSIQVLFPTLLTFSKIRVKPVPPILFFFIFLFFPVSYSVFLCFTRGVPYLWFFLCFLVFPFSSCFVLLVLGFFSSSIPKEDSSSAKYTCILSKAFCMASTCVGAVCFLTKIDVASSH